MARAWLAAATLAALLALPPGTAPPADDHARMSGWAVPQGDGGAPAWWPWALSVTGAALGRPEGPWPRPTPPLGAPMPRDPDHLSIVFVLVSNLGLTTFEGRVAGAVPEVGLEWRGSPLVLEPVSPVAWPMLWLLLAIALPADAPDVVTLHLWFEDLAGVRVGERVEHRYATYAGELPCQEGARIVDTAGQQRVRFPWDAPLMVYTACNPDPVERRATIQLRDAATGRPALTTQGLYARMDAVSEQLQPEWWGSPLRPYVPPGGFTGWLFAPEEKTAPRDFVPQMLVRWDHGPGEVVTGEPITFAPEPDLPWVPMPPT